MDAMPMEIRSTDTIERTIEGVVAPYDEVSYLVGDPGGERLCRGAFARSIDHRGDRVPLFRNHDHGARLGTSIAFTEDNDGLVGSFRVNAGHQGDALLEDIHNQVLTGFSVGFQRVGQPVRAVDGVTEIREAKLMEVSAVAFPAYEGAGLLSVRTGEHLDEVLAPFKATVDVNLDPIPPVW